MRNGDAGGQQIKTLNVVTKQARTGSVREREREKTGSNRTGEKMGEFFFSPFIPYSFLTVKKNPTAKNSLSGWITSMNYNTALRSIYFWV
jgi:hypothetical protein